MCIDSTTFSFFNNNIVMKASYTYTFKNCQHNRELFGVALTKHVGLYETHIRMWVFDVTIEKSRSS